MDDETTTVRSLEQIARDIHRRIAKLNRDSWEQNRDIGRCLAEARSHFGEDDRGYGRWCAEQEFEYSSEWLRKLRILAEREDEVREHLATELRGSGRFPGVNRLYDWLRGRDDENDQDDAPRPEMSFDLVGDDGRVGTVEATSREVRLTTPDGIEYVFKPSDSATGRALRSAVGKRDEDAVRRMAEGYAAASANRIITMLRDLLAYPPAELWMLSASERLDAYSIFTRDLPPWVEDIVKGLEGPFRTARHPLLRAIVDGPGPSPSSAEQRPEIELDDRAAQLNSPAPASLPAPGEH